MGSGSSPPLERPRILAVPRGPPPAALLRRRRRLLRALGGTSCGRCRPFFCSGFFSQMGARLGDLPALLPPQRLRHLCVSAVASPVRCPWQRLLVLLRTVRWRCQEQKGRRSVRACAGAGCLVAPVPRGRDRVGPPGVAGEGHAGPPGVEGRSSELLCEGLRAGHRRMRCWGAGCPVYPPSSALAAAAAAAEQSPGAAAVG